MPFTINGKAYNGDRVDLVGGRLIIDGKEQAGPALSGVVEIRVLEGALLALHTDASVSCGEVHGDVRAGDSVNCGNVAGSVNAGDSVVCGHVGQSVIAGDSVRAQNISGAVRASGDVICRSRG